MTDGITITEYQRRRQEHAERICATVVRKPYRPRTVSPRRHGTPVKIGNRTYPSGAKAMKELGVSWRGMQRLIQTKGMTNVQH